MVGPGRLGRFLLLPFRRDGRLPPRGRIRGRGHHRTRALSRCRAPESTHLHLRPTAEDAARRRGGDGGGCRRHAITIRHTVRFLKYEFFTAILPFSNVKTSHPLTSIFLPSAVVPVKSHSDTPRSPATKCRASPKCASGKILKTLAKASR